MNQPARVPRAAARLRPFFFKMKLAPMNALEHIASISPVRFSETPISTSSNSNPIVAYKRRRRCACLIFPPREREREMEFPQWREPQRMAQREHRCFVLSAKRFVFFHSESDGCDSHSLTSLLATDGKQRHFYSDLDSSEVSP